ncbi:MAG: hypothetical protein KAS07_03420 [Candidatus Pacebacteria bacterium]|nr:hypothetical protein [Candidatus Paceibacterota bacterium]
MRLRKMLNKRTFIVVEILFIVSVFVWAVIEGETSWFAGTAIVGLPLGLLVSYLIFRIVLKFEIKKIRKYVKDVLLLGFTLYVLLSLYMLNSFDLSGSLDPMIEMFLKGM